MQFKGTNLQEAATLFRGVARARKVEDEKMIKISYANDQNIKISQGSGVVTN
jgi:hypothetical protein